MPDSHLTDPLGRTITLHDRTWHGHIIKGHPEMTGHRDLAEAAITSPEAILHSRGDTNCRLYMGVGPRNTVKLVVVADIVQGHVKTAYLAKRTKGTQEWP